MTVSAETAAMIAANRRRYEQLKAAGQDAGLPLPPPSVRGVAVEAATVLQRETVPGGWYCTLRLARGERLRLQAGEGCAGVSWFAWNADDSSERYNAGDTVKVQWTAALAKGRLLLSDMGRVLAAIVEDSCGAHDALVGGSTPETNAIKYGDASLRNTRDNFVLAAGKHGLTRRDVAACLTFFAPVVTDAQGRFHWRDGAVQAGDYVELRAEMNLLIAISNCPHPLAPDRLLAPPPIEVMVLRAAVPDGADFCRVATAENRRAYDNNAAMLAREVRA